LNLSLGGLAVRVFPIDPDPFDHAICECGRKMDGHRRAGRSSHVRHGQVEFYARFNFQSRTVKRGPVVETRLRRSRNAAAASSVRDQFTRTVVFYYARRRSFIKSKKKKAADGFPNEKIIKKVIRPFFVVVCRVCVYIYIRRRAGRPVFFRFKANSSPRPMAIFSPTLPGEVLREKLYARLLSPRAF